MTDAAPAAPSRPTRVWILPALMLTGAVAGILLGGLMGSRWGDRGMEPLVLGVRLCGVVFLSLLKAIIVPLVVTSIVVGITKMGDLRRVGRIAGATAAYFFSTSFLAVMTGMMFVNLIGPGRHSAGTPAAPLAAAQAAKAAQSPAQAIYEVISGMFPPNLVGAAVDGNILGLIVFSLLFAVVLSLEGERGRPLVDVLDIANESLLRLVRFIVWLAPLGIFGLVADRLGKAGGGTAVWAELGRLVWYAATVLLGLALHAVVTLPVVLRFLGGQRPGRFAVGMGDALLTAFGTASSAATMAVTLRCTVGNNRVSRRAADFVIPLGTTVNMDGTALYEAVAVIFIAQSMGLELSFAQQLIVLITATLAAVGAAAIPEAGLVTMVLVLNAVGLPAEGVGLLLSIDWILDRFRTAVNVWGDSVGAAVVDRRLPAEPSALPDGST